MPTKAKSTRAREKRELRESRLRRTKSTPHKAPHDTTCASEPAAADVKTPPKPPGLLKRLSNSFLSRLAKAESKDAARAASKGTPIKLGGCNAATTEAALASAAKAASSAAAPAPSPALTPPKPAHSPPSAMTLPPAPQPPPSPLVDSKSHTRLVNSKSHTRLLAGFRHTRLQREAARVGLAPRLTRGE